MFKGKEGTNTKPKMSRNAEANSPERLNRIVEGTTFEGDIKSDSNIRIDGKIKGTINTKGRLVVGPSGHIDGEVACQNADVEGTVVGKINVDQLLTLKATAKLQGDINTNKLAIEPGAAFSGSCAMGGVVKNIQSPQKEDNDSEKQSKDVAGQR